MTSQKSKTKMATNDRQLARINTNKSRSGLFWMPTIKWMERIIQVGVILLNVRVWERGEGQITWIEVRKDFRKYSGFWVCIDNSTSYKNVSSMLKTWKQLITFNIMGSSSKGLLHIKGVNTLDCFKKKLSREKTIFRTCAYDVTKTCGLFVYISEPTMWGYKLRETKWIKSFLGK